MNYEEFKDNVYLRETVRIMNDINLHNALRSNASCTDYITGQEQISGSLRNISNSMCVVSILLFNITDGNGTERAVVNLANSLCKYGDYKVHIISCMSSFDAVPYFAIEEGVSLHNLGYCNRNKPPYLRIVKDVARICREINADFILGTTHALNTILALVNAGNIKKIACEHMNYSAAPSYSRAIRRLAYPRLDAVVLLTESDRRHYVFCENTYVIPNCVQIHEESSNCENKIMLAVGRYTYQKGFDMLIDAFALVHDRIPEWRLRIVGGGEDELLLRNKIKTYGLENKIELIPFTKRIQTEYLNAGIYVLSSRFEGFVLVLMEAKAAGLPTVAFNCPEGPADIIRDGKDGFLVEPNNVDALAEKMTLLAGDESMRKQFGAHGKDDIKRFSPENVFKMWDALFRGLSSEFFN